MKIKKGDNVIIISGKDKGKQGKVLKAMPKQGKILVENVNLKKKHLKPRKANQKGQIIDFSTPLHVSNAALLDSKTGHPSRAGYKFDGGKKVRIAKKSGIAI